MLKTAIKIKKYVSKKKLNIKRKKEIIILVMYNILNE